MDTRLIFNKQALSRKLHCGYDETVTIPCCSVCTRVGNLSLDARFCVEVYLDTICKIL